jgi:prepilin-type N-terminal cleavage/methylation domain-containing protein
MKKEGGFTFIELMVTMVVFVLIIAAASNVFTGLLTQFKQQSKIAETNIEGVVGLEMLRQDIEHAGYGLPWNVAGILDNDGDGNLWEDLAGYNESSVAGVATTCNDASRDIDGDTNAGEAPRGICQGNNTGFNGSDYLVIKSMNVANNGTDRKWTYLHVGNVKTTWTPDCENVNRLSDCTVSDAVRIIVVSPGFNLTNSRSLVVNNGAFFTSYNDTSGFAPGDNTDIRVLYGVNPTTDLRMPFNRADYYIRSSNVPQRCARNNAGVPVAGVLVKAVVSHDDGDFDLPPEDGVTDELPLLDCVADFQVVFGLDNDNDKDFEPGVSADGYNDDISALSAGDIREQVKQIRIAILVHEGAKDMNYTYPNPSISVDVNTGVGSTFNLLTRIGPDYKYYRWKVYTMVVNPIDLK